MYDALAVRYENSDKRKAKTYREKVELYDSEAEEDKKIILDFLRNKESGMIFNYSYHTHTERTVYPFASGGYAIWAGLFDIEKPEETGMLMKLVDYLTKNLEGPDGIYPSNIETGLAWDKPHVKAVQQGMIVNGLRRYAKAFAEKNKTDESKKLTEIADRIAGKFIKAQSSKGKDLKDTATMAAILDLNK